MTDSKGGKTPFHIEVMGLVLLALPLLVTVSTIEAANWVKGLPSLKALVLVSLIMWACLARSSIPWWIGHTFALLVGLAVAFVLGAFTLSEAGGFANLVSQLAGWFGAVGSQEGNRGAVITGMLLIGVTLWVGHSTAWLAYRRPFPWMAALPGLIALLVVLSFLPSDYYWYFFLYLLAAAPGVAYRYSRLRNVPGQLVPLVGTLVAGVVVMAVTLVPVWRAPAPEEPMIPLASSIEGPWYSFRENWSDLFYGVPNRKEWPHFSPPRDLPFTGPIEPGSEVLFVVESEVAYRWRTRVYDTYTSTGWERNEPLVKKATTEVPLQSYVEELKDRNDVTIRVRIHSKGNTLLSVGEPMAASFPSKVELSPQPTFKFYLEGPQVSYLPLKVKEHQKQLILSPPRSIEAAHDLLASSDPPLSLSLQVLGFNVTPDLESVTLPGTPYVTLERKKAAPEPPVALLAQRVLVPPRQYRTVGSISDASAGALREAGRKYPASVTDRYLQLPYDFPDTVRKLARGLIKDEDNPYDMAESIRIHLLRLPYSLDVAQAPPGRDWVEFFLFEQRRGYCQNYASAMITMLRSLGIPARLVVGFAPGVLRDKDRGVWEVQSRHYHVWPEVYFPSYGWVEFEPTPAGVQPALVELGFQDQGGPLIASSELDFCDDPFLSEFCIDPDFTDLALDGQLDGFPDEGDDGLASPPPSDGGVGFLSSRWSALGLGLALAAFGMVGVVSYVRISLSRLDDVTVTYASICFLGRLAGVGLRPQDTPWEYSFRLTEALPRQREAISNVTERFMHFRYGGPGKLQSVQEMGNVRAPWRSIRNALVARIILRIIPHRS